MSIGKILSIKYIGRLGERSSHITLHIKVVLYRFGSGKRRRESERGREGGRQKSMRNDSEGMRESQRGGIGRRKR